jgi:type I restriction enzyme S subunit
MRDNWKEIALGKIGTFKSNGVDKIIYPGEIIVSLVNYMDVYRFPKLFNQNDFSETSVKASLYDSFNLKKGDVLFTPSSETPEDIGHSSAIMEDLNNTVYSYHVVRFRADENILNDDFKAYAFNQPFVLKQFEKKAAGSTRYTLTRGSFENTIVRLPPLSQQRKIANILSTCDQVIEKTEAAIAKYQALKQGMMHDLFTRGIDVKTGKLRPSYQDAPELYKESELGMIPKEWEEGQFIDFADERISHSFTGGPFGSDLQTRDYTKEGVRIIQLQNIGDGKFNNGYKIYTSEEKANYLRACNIYPGEIILSKMAEPIARACIIPISNDRYLMASDGIRLSIDKKRFNLRFVLETINQKRFRNIAEIRSTGTTRSRIGLTELKGIPVCYPQKNEQDIIGIKLDNLEESIEIEQSALSKYQQLKAGLMQDLLTGKVEVSVAEEVLKN